MFGVKISSDTLKGTLIEGFEGDKWLIETEGADIKISSFRFDWKPSELTRPSLHITEVVAGDIAIVTKRTPPKEEEPSKGLPDSIDLPVTVYLDRLETGKISVGKRFDKQTVYLDHLHAAYHYDKKRTPPPHQNRRHAMEQLDRRGSARFEQTLRPQYRHLYKRPA